MLKKILSVAIVFFFSFQADASYLSKYVNTYNLGSNSNSGIFVQDIDTKEVLYKKNSQQPLNPASILKTLVLGASYFVLGDDYQFETALYKDNDEIYLKLGADALLSQSDLNNLFSQLKEKYPNFEIKKVYIDDSIIEKASYPSTWLEEDKWPNQREITPYVVDDNYFEISIKRSSLATKVDIIQDGDYKLPIINELTLGEKQDFTIERLYGDDSSIVTLKGTIKEDVTLKLPVLKPEINFKIKVKNSIAKNKFIYSDAIDIKNISKNAQKVAVVKHDIKEIIRKTLTISDNLAPELAFRAAAAKYINYSHTATFDDAIIMFNDIFKDEITNSVKIVDSSGVSRENYVTCEFMCKCLMKLYECSDFKTLLAQPNEGTLSNRLLFLKDNLRAKTGTLSCTSALLGTLKTKNNKNLVFCTIVQNSPKRKAVIKNFENRFVGLLYRKY